MDAPDGAHHPPPQVLHLSQLAAGVRYWTGTAWHLTPEEDREELGKYQWRQWFTYDKTIPCPEHGTEFFVEHR